MLKHFCNKGINQWNIFLFHKHSNFIDNFKEIINIMKSNNIDKINVIKYDDLTKSHVIEYTDSDLETIKFFF